METKKPQKAKRKLSKAKKKKIAGIAITAVLLIWYFFFTTDSEYSLIADHSSLPVESSSELPIADVEYTPIPYTLKGESGEKEYDANGNPVNTADYLTSIGSYKDVLPKGFNASALPEYHGEAVVTVNGNEPFFTNAEIELAKQGYFEYYGPLDSLGRCTVAFDCLGKETMPGSTKRGSISSIHPSGWKQARYDCVDSETVMTRAHLAGYMLSSENANDRNLISGTRYMNSDSMLPYEEAVSNYLYKGRGFHVLYRVTPVFAGSNLMANGILMEARSVEDGGLFVKYCVFVYNVQPGLKFNYANGRSEYSGIFFDTFSGSVVTQGIRLGNYVLDMSSSTVHTSNCSKLSEADGSVLAPFKGDMSMTGQWSHFGYKLCSCVK